MDAAVLTLAGLTSARDHGVSAEYTRALTALGYPRLSLDDLIRLRDHGVSPEYVRQLKDSGYAGLTINDLVSMRDRGLPADRIRSAIDYIRSAKVRAMFRSFVDPWMR